MKTEYKQVHGLNAYDTKFQCEKILDHIPPQKSGKITMKEDATGFCSGLVTIKPRHLNNMASASVH